MAKPETVTSHTEEQVDSPLERFGSLAAIASLIFMLWQAYQSTLQPTLSAPQTETTDVEPVTK